MFESLFGAHPLVGVVLSVHGGAVLVAAPGALFKRPNLARLGYLLLLAAFLLNTWLIADRWIEAGRPPFKTLFETLLFYPWCLGLVTLVLAGVHRLHVLVPFASAASLMGLAYALYRPDVEVVNLPPALQSVWFVPHVVVYFIAYAGLFLSFALATLALGAPHLARIRNRASGAPGARVTSRAAVDPAFERYAHGAAIFGFVMLTLGLFMGGVWAKYAWGDYWTWDPKENWALVSWLAYMLYIHLRLMGGWHGRRAMSVLVLAFAAVVFTYLGMSLLPTVEGSLHAYQ